MNDADNPYLRTDLLGAIDRALRDAGIDPLAVTVDELAPIDEFHLGWRATTVGLIDALALRSSDQVLDIGSGIGGTARCFAHRTGCQVLGVDVTPEYVDVATTLTQRCGLQDRVSFVQGSALELPLDDECMDVVTMVHVGMNIADKTALAREIYRVLRPGGRVAIYDIMRGDDGSVCWPMPWALSPSASYVASKGDYIEALNDSGLAIEASIDRREFVLERLRERAEYASRTGPPKLGLHVLIGPDAGRRLANLVTALKAGALTPIELRGRRV